MPDDPKMRRTQIYLTERQMADIKRLAAARGVASSELIREAVDEKLAALAAETASWKATLRQVRGLWAARDDIDETMGAIRRVLDARMGRDGRNADR